MRPLTPEVRQILTLAANGLTTPDIALSLGVPPERVRAVFQAAMQDFGVTSKFALILATLRLHLIDPPH